MNDKVFIELYRRHVNGVYRYLLVKTGNVYDAQHLTAQTFQAARQALTQGPAAEAEAVWLIRLARRQVADYFQRPPQAITRKPPTPPGLEPLQHIACALHTLPAGPAEALALRVFAGLSAAEVGEVLGASEADIKQWVYHAIRHLQAHPMDAPTEESQEWIEIEMKL